MSVKTLDKKQSSPIQLFKAQDHDSHYLVRKEILPKHWKTVVSSEILDIRDGTHDTPKYVPHGVPLITSKNLKGNEIDFDKVSYISKEDHAEISKRSKVEAGDILFAMIGTIGNPAIIRGDANFSIKNVGLFKKNESVILSLYLVNFLRSNLFEKQLSERKLLKGTTQKFIPLGNLRSIGIPLPPLSEQHAIVSKIEELLSELDKGKQQLETAQQQLKVYRQAVLKWAFEGKLSELGLVGLKDNKKLSELRLKGLKDDRISIANDNTEILKSSNQVNPNSDNLPKGWKWVKLSDIGTWRGGGTPTKSRKEFWENGNIMWVSPKDMKSQIINDTIDRITLDAIDNSSAKLIPKGSVLFVVRSGILRRTLPIALTISEVTVNQDLQAFTPKDILPEYVYWYVAAKNDDIRKKCSKDGTTVESIESSSLKNYLIPICSVEEQHLIVQEIESRLSVCDKVEETINQSLAQAETLRQSILKKAFEGKLV